MKKYFATVHLIINAEDESEACDAVSGLLSETGIYDTEHGEPTLLNWAYNKVGERYIGPRAVEVPDDYNRDDYDRDTEEIQQYAQELNR